MKGKARAIAIVLMMTAGTVGVEAEEIITDLPGSSEHSGAIYGSIYDKREEEKPGGDIEIEVPPEPDTKPDTQPNGDKGGSTGGKEGTAGGSSDRSREPGGNSSHSSREPEGTEEQYSWQKERGVLRIRRSLMERAKEEKKGLVFRVLNEEGEAEYRIRIEAKDIEEREPEEIEVKLGECPHRKEIAGRIEGGEKVVGILLCQQEEIEIPMRIGVRAERGWEREKGVEEYEYGGERLKYIASGIEIDEEGMIEIEMEEGKDRIFTKEEIETGGRDIRTFVEGIVEGNEEVDRSKGIAAIMLAGAGVSLGGMGVWRYLKRRGKRT